MIIDRWKSYGRRTNKQKRKENKKWWKIIIIIIIKNNIIIMKKEKSKLSVSIQFAFTLTVYSVNMAYLNLFVVLEWILSNSSK